MNNISMHTDQKRSKHMGEPRGPLTLKVNRSQKLTADSFLTSKSNMVHYPHAFRKITANREKKSIGLSGSEASHHVHEPSQRFIKILIKVSEVKIYCFF